MNNQVHPIELTLAITLSSIDSLLWIINELLGLHTNPQVTETAPAAPTTREERSDYDQYWNQYLEISKVTTAPILKVASMTKRQLQAYTGIKSSRYNKADLLSIALGDS